MAIPSLKRLMNMIRYMIVSICALIFSMSGAYAQTPIEKLIDKYADVRGARDLIASGAEMRIARSLIRRTPLASIAPEVQVLEVLKMQNASRNDILMFERDLKEALETYEYYGQTEGANGMVDIYISKKSADTIDELVLYNPEIYSLNSLKGTFSVSELVSIDKGSK